MKTYNNTWLSGVQSAAAMTRAAPGTSAGGGTSAGLAPSPDDPVLRAHAHKRAWAVVKQEFEKSGHDWVRHHALSDDEQPPLTAHDI
jgi:hypothetical protein